MKHHDPNCVVVEFEYRPEKRPRTPPVRPRAASTAGAVDRLALLALLQVASGRGGARRAVRRAS